MTAAVFIRCVRKSAIHWLLPFALSWLVGVHGALAAAHTEARASSGPIVSALPLLSNGVAFGGGVLACLLLLLSVWPLAGRWRELVEMKAAERRSTMEALLENLPGMVYRTADGDSWQLDYVSAGCLEVTGFSPATLTNERLPWIERIHPDDREQVRGEVERAIESHTPYHMNYRIRNVREEEIWVCEQGIAVRGEDGEVVAREGFIADISEKISLELELEQSRKMEAIGRFAGGIAHDFNNLLVVIDGSSELLLDQLPPEDPARDTIEDILMASRSAAGLTRQLLAVSRMQHLRPEPLDLNQVVTQMKGMVQRAAGPGVHVAIQLAERVGPVRFDPTQIQQIVMNLVLNARDAMPSGGELLVSTEIISAGSGPRPEPAERMPGTWVVLTVRDTGHGMDASTLERIFEPFFTTKHPDKGTGLGLATVFGIVKQEGGEIRVDSTPGAGTTFRVYLPSEGMR